MELAKLRMVALAIASGSLASTVVAKVVANSDESAMTGSIILVITALASWAVVGWLRQRPISPSDVDGYGSTAMVKMAVAETPALLGFGLAVSFGPWYLAVVGLAASMVGLVLAWPSESDRERHQLLYMV